MKSCRITTRGNRIKPRLMCNQHLVGEHGELHKHLSSLKKGYDLTKRFIGGQISPSDYVRRHDALAEEIQRRADARGDLDGGHKSPLSEDINNLFSNCTLEYMDPGGLVIIGKGSSEWEFYSFMHVSLKISNLVLLVLRCDDCRKKVNGFITNQDTKWVDDDLRSKLIGCLS